MWQKSPLPVIAALVSLALPSPGASAADDVGADFPYTWRIQLRAVDLDPSNRSLGSVNGSLYGELAAQWRLAPQIPARLDDAADVEARSARVKPRVNGGRCELRREPQIRLSGGCRRPSSRRRSRLQDRTDALSPLDATLQLVDAGAQCVDVPAARNRQLLQRPGDS